MNYPDYVELFNTGDDAALVERYFHDEIVFTGGTRSHPGKEGLLAFLNWAHDGVREVIRLQNFLQQGDLIFARSTWISTPPRSGRTSRSATSIPAIRSR
jgi:ketosteroid isomerase-like protein